MKKPIEIGALSFATKSLAIEHFKAILHKYEFGKQIPEPDATELAWLLERHPEYQEKVGCGVDHFRVRAALYGTRCFEIVRTNGSNTDFSFRQSIDGRAPTALSELLNALRAEVADDIKQRKREWFAKNGDASGRVRCAITGTLVTIDEAHADHAPPRTFGTLAIAFIEARNISPDPKLVTPPADNQYQPRLVDSQFAKEWRAYHHKLAAIRIVAKHANLSRSHEGKVKRKDRQLRMAN